MGSQFKPGTLTLAAVFLLLLATKVSGQGNAPDDSQSEKSKTKPVKKEPAFPDLFKSIQSNPPKFMNPLAKLVTETVELNGVVTTQEEFIDLTASKSAYVLSDTRTVIYANAEEDVILKYRPYTCQKFDSADQVLQGSDNLSIRFGESKLRVFGVLGLWLWASQAEKSYSYEKKVYTGTISRLYHVWQFKDEIGEHLIKFFFLGAIIQLNLDKVEIYNKHEELSKTINVLDLKYELDLRTLQHVLEVPLGYGCAKALQGSNGKKPNSDIEDEDSFWSDYIWSNSRVKLEVTSTRQLADSSRLTDTIYVELAHANVGVELNQDALLTKIRSKDQDTKTIFNHFYNVRYHIDSKLGQCRASHLKPHNYLSKKTMSEYDDEDNLELKFANGLVLPFNRKQIRNIFSSDSENYFSIIRSATKFSIKSSGNQLYQFLEKPTYKWTENCASNAAGQPVVAREMATIVSSTDSESGALSAPRVDSLTIWLLDEKTESKVLESYHINVIEEMSPLEDWPDVVSLFDVSEDCYFNDPTKKAGLDFAWMELFYPIENRRSNLLEKNEFNLKQVIYSKMQTSELFTVYNMPRLEVMFTDEGLYVNFLVLDLPPLESLMEMKANFALPPASKDSSTTEYSQSKEDSEDGQLSFIVPDIDHCSKLCQLHACLTMTYCRDKNECTLSLKPAKIYDSIPKTIDEGKEQNEADFVSLVPMKSCVTYSTDQPDRFKKLMQQRLSNVISKLQHQEYDNFNMPKMPDEVALPRYESGVSEVDYQKALTDYITEVAKTFKDTDSRLPSLTITLIADEHFIAIMPTKFHTHHDPLDQFNLDFSDKNSSPTDFDYGGEDGDAKPVSRQFDDSQLFDKKQIVQFFHDGLANYHFDFNAFINSDVKNQLKLFNGLTYDQCALACIDSKCGSFSYCAFSNECILTQFVTIEDAISKKLVSSEKDCSIAQRDFVQSFQMYNNVEKPRQYQKSTSFVSVNDCASNCATQTVFGCFSFDVCYGENGSKTCYLQEQRQLESVISKSVTDDEVKGDKLERKKKSSTKSDKKTAQKPEYCDHYERSHLAEFTEIQAREIKPEELNKLKTSTYYGKTTFDCAEICLNELTDCSAFQFCFVPPAARNDESTNNYAQSCIMIQSKPQIKDEQQKLEFLVDEEERSVSLATEESVRKSDERKKTVSSKNSLLNYSYYCHLFALKPNTMQAHLRDLAMGQTMTVREHDKMLKLAQTKGHVFTWAGFFLLILSMLVGATFVGSGLALAGKRNKFLGSYLDRFRNFVRNRFW